MVVTADAVAEAATFTGNIRVTNTVLVAKRVEDRLNDNVKANSLSQNEWREKWKLESDSNHYFFHFNSLSQLADKFDGGNSISEVCWRRERNGDFE